MVHLDIVIMLRLFFFEKWLLTHAFFGFQGLSPAYEQAHVGVRPFDPGII